MRFRKHLSGAASFQSAILPPLLDAHIEVNESLNTLLNETETALSQWKEHTQSLPDGERLTLQHREAEISWLMSVGETLPMFALQYQQPTLSAADEEDVANLEHATRYAFEWLDELPISRRLLSDAHYLACKSQRNEGSYPGEFRTSPIWIGGKDASLTSTDVYVPPVDGDIVSAFTDLERYIHYADDVHPLIRIALTHYQFEAIHPFVDANGRIGRLLTQLQLTDYGLADGPYLQLSEQLSRHSINYYIAIQSTHLLGDYTNWVRFFLSSIKHAATLHLPKNGSDTTFVQLV